MPTGAPARATEGDFVVKSSREAVCKPTSQTCSGKASLNCRRHKSPRRHLQRPIITSTERPISAAEDEPRDAGGLFEIAMRLSMIKDDSCNHHDTSANSVTNLEYRYRYYNFQIDVLGSMRLPSLLPESGYDYQVGFSSCITIKQGRDNSLEEMTISNNPVDELAAINL